MKKGILRTTIILSLLLSLGIATPVEAKGCKLNKTKASVTVGKTIKIKMKNAKKKVKWSTNNKKIAKITKKTNGYVKVKGVKKGTAKIIAKTGNKKYVCKVNVKKAGKKVSKKKLLDAYNKVTRAGMTYCLFYMNNDTIPELLCFSSDECCVYTYKNGSAQRVPDPVGWTIDGMHGGIYFVPRKNVLYTRTNMGMYIRLYNNFKIVKEASIHYSYATHQESYCVGDNEVSESTFNATVKGWGVPSDFSMKEKSMYDTLEKAYQHIVK